MRVVFSKPMGNQWVLKLSCGHVAEWPLSHHEPEVGETYFCHACDTESVHISSDKGKAATRALFRARGEE